MTTTVLETLVGEGLTKNQLIYQKYKEAIKQRTKQYKHANRERYMFYNCKKRANKASLEFNLDMSDFVVPEICPVLGIPLFWSDGKKTDHTPSMDRVDNDKGYIKGNVCIISEKANRMKQNHTLASLKLFVNYMESFYV